jgi:hypothetical protein
MDNGRWRVASDCDVGTLEGLYRQALNDGVTIVRGELGGRCYAKERRGAMPMSYGRGSGMCSAPTSRQSRYLRKGGR